jgi:thioredoxin 2
MVDDQNFSREVLAADETVLVDCWAPWCGPCKMLAPIMDELAAKYLGGIKIVKLNVDENPFIAHKYDIKSIPTLLFIKDGNLMETLSGLRAKEEIEGRILALLKPS